MPNRSWASAPSRSAGPASAGSERSEEQRRTLTALTPSSTLERVMARCISRRNPHDDAHEILAGRPVYMLRPRSVNHRQHATCAAHRARHRHFVLRRHPAVLAQVSPMLCRLTCRPRGAAGDAWVRRHPAIVTTRSSPKGSVGGCHTASQDVSDPPGPGGRALAAFGRGVGHAPAASSRSIADDDSGLGRQMPPPVIVACKSRGHQRIGRFFAVTNSR